MFNKIKSCKIKTVIVIGLIYLLGIGLNFAHARDFKLSKSEFLSRLDQNLVKLEKNSILPIPGSATTPQGKGLLDIILEQREKEFAGFKKEMFYAGVVISNDYQYYIFYEWYDRGCIFGTTDLAAFKKLDPNNATDNKKGFELSNVERDSLEKIDKKYCEKLLGINLPNGGLTKIKK